MKSKKLLLPYFLLLGGVLILLNILANRFFFRIDFTDDQRYTLSDATHNIINHLDAPVTVTAYFSEDLPPDISRVRTDFKNLLQEFHSVSHGKVNYEFISPSNNSDTEQQAVDAGIQPVVINVREKDQAVQKKAFLGAVVHYDDKTEVIPFLQPGSGMEYALASAIRKLTVKEKTEIGLIQGNGETAKYEFAQVMQELDVLYNVRNVTLNDSVYLGKYKTLILDAPKDSFSPEQLKLLDNYLAQGGNLLVAFDRVNGQLERSRGVAINTGLETWLANKGIQVEPSFVTDASCSTISLRQQSGLFSFSTQLQFPYLPIITTFANHPVTKGLEAVSLQFASPMKYTGDSALTFIPLAKTSRMSGKQHTPVYFDIQHHWTDKDFPLSNEVVAGLLEGKITGPANSRMIVITDGDFAVNGSGQSARQLPGDNINFFVNAVDWLSDDTGLIDLRTKGISSRPLAKIQDGKKSFLKYFNFLLPILLIIIYGVFRAQRKRWIRIKRMEDDYV